MDRHIIQLGRREVLKDGISLRNSRSEDHCESWIARVAVVRKKIREGLYFGRVYQDRTVGAGSIEVENDNEM